MPITFGTKAETLADLAGRGFPVPPLMYFEANDWVDSPERILSQIHDRYSGYASLAVRSSSTSEDGLENSQAGAYHSVLHVPSTDFKALIQAVNEVKLSLPHAKDQIFIQPMVENVAMSGVLMTRALDDGSPYYVINYDDISGRTNTITSGAGISKTVYIYKGALESDFDSPRLLAVVKLAQDLEKTFAGAPLDIEFAVDSSEKIYLLQVRRICTERHWITRIGEKISRRMHYVKEFIQLSTGSRHGLFGRKTILGVMPDWNPAEMIGVSPRPLAFSLYRELITRRIWSLARALMGYRKLPPAELMIAVSGRPYIDVRASFNSFLPAGLADNTCEKLVNAWLDRLDRNPNFHDKVEFDIVHTVTDLDFAENFSRRYPGVLNSFEMNDYCYALTKLTNTALNRQSLALSLEAIETLSNKRADNLERPSNVFDCVAHLAELMEECAEYGTRHFAIIARHAFIAEAMLRSAVRLGALRQERVAALKRSIRTVSRDLSDDFLKTFQGKLSKESFLRRYGHLRPGTYDILSPSYSERQDLFENCTPCEAGLEHEDFVLSPKESQELNKLLSDGGINISADALLSYTRASIAGREYAKFIFTRHVSYILAILALWGEKMSLSREEVSFLPVSDVLNSLSTPLPAEGGRYFRDRSREYRVRYELDRAFKMSYIIRSPRDVYIVPQHRSAPNFITSKRLNAPVLYLDACSKTSMNLSGHIVCIESADPGYDWIFTRNIAGLVTRYGGANSHMAIRCAEYGLPAAIGCGDVIFERVSKAKVCLLDCQGKSVSAFSEPGDAT